MEKTIRIIAYIFLGFFLFILLLSFYVFSYTEKSKSFDENYKVIKKNNKENILIAAGIPSAIWGLKDFANILAKDEKDVYVFNSNGYYFLMRYAQRVL